MPELPEVQTTATSLQPLLGQVVEKISVFQPKLRWQIPEDLQYLTGSTLTHIERRAKYLILNFHTPSQINKKLLIHLGMSGSLQQHALNTQKRKHDHVIFIFGKNHQKIQLHYHDPRRFGAILWLENYQDKLINHLGVEPLSEKFTGEYLYQCIQQKSISRPIKSVIMEQTIVVGVGNIYATESLFLSAIHPASPANQLSLTQLTILVEHIRQILQQAILQGGSSLKDFSVGEGKTGYFQQTLHMYGKKGEPCPVCQTIIESIKINQRASTFCPTCQPFPSLANH